MSVQVGGAAPEFDLDSDEGTRLSLGDFEGKWLVLYFYPRDNTPGCTQEGQSFAAAFQQFKKLKTLIVGISPDSVSSHEKFKSKMGFPFELLSDVDRTVCKRYDVIQEKSMYGKKYMGVERSTFLIDPQGVLRAEWRKVKVNGHAEALLAAVKAL